MIFVLQVRLKTIAKSQEHGLHKIALSRFAWIHIHIHTTCLRRLQVHICDVSSRTRQSMCELVWDIEARHFPCACDIMLYKRIRMTQTQGKYECVLQQRCTKKVSRESHPAETNDTHSQTAVVISLKYCACIWHLFLYLHLWLWLCGTSHRGGLWSLESQLYCICFVKTRS